MILGMFGWEHLIQPFLMPPPLLHKPPAQLQIDVYKRQLMTGNEVGCLLLDYILSCRAAAGTLPADPVVVKTIVTSDLAARIAEKYGCQLVEVLTGFKYIGEQIGLLEKEGHPERYVFGFEESYGYLSGSYVRDKDGVVASMLVCEMAAYYKEKGLSRCV